MPKLTWIGKEKVINHDRDVPYRVLEHKYGFNNGVQTETPTETENKIIHGDNLEALKSLLPQYEGKIKCIYIDPPYNTGNENWVYNDNVNDPKIKKWLNEVVGKEGEDLSRHDKWLCMMYPRLKLLHKLLANDGAIFISIDDNEQAHLKLICDEIFGGNNFLATLFWRGMHTVRNSSKDYNKNTEFIIVYAKNKNNLIPSSDNQYYLRAPQDKINNYKLDDKDGNGKYKLDPIYARNEYTPYEFTFKNGIVWSAPRGTYPRYSIESLTTLENNSCIIFTGKEPKAKRYLKDVQEGVPPSTLLDSSIVGFNKDATKLLNEIFDGSKVFDQPKPPTLIEFLLQIQRKVDKNDFLILDSFAGSGTTAHAVLNLNKADGGNRKFILIEMEDYAESITAERVKRVINGYAKTEGTGGAFNYFELGEPLFNTENLLNPNISVEVIKNYVWYSETRGALPTVNTANDNTYFLGALSGTAYYFYYELASVTTLDDAFLETVRTAAENYIMYADRCTLSAAQLEKYKIIFKKIPRDISRF